MIQAFIIFQIVSYKKTINNERIYRFRKSKKKPKELVFYDQKILNYDILTMEQIILMIRKGYANHGYKLNQKIEFKIQSSY